jgi:hypothetical protein
MHDAWVPARRRVNREPMGAMTGVDRMLPSLDYDLPPVHRARRTRQKSAHGTESENAMRASDRYSDWRS